MTTLYTNHINGVLSAGISSGDTTITSSVFADLPVVTGGDVVWLVLDPWADAGDPEVVQVTAHSSGSTSVTVTRAAQSTTARAHLISVVVTSPVTATDLTSLEAVKGGLWTSFTPAWSASLTVGNATQKAFYKYLDPQTVHLHVDFTFGSTTAAASTAAWTMTLPLSLAGRTDHRSMGVLVVNSSGGGGFSSALGVCEVTPGSTVVDLYDVYPATLNDELSPGNTWTTGSRFAFDIVVAI